jgi:hypothetical protein
MKVSFLIFLELQILAYFFNFNLNFIGSSTSWIFPSSYPSFVEGVDKTNPANIVLEELQIYGDSNVAMTNVQHGSDTPAIALNVNSIQVRQPLSSLVTFFLWL